MTKVNYDNYKMIEACICDLTDYDGSFSMKVKVFEKEDDEKWKISYFYPTLSNYCPICGLIKNDCDCKENKYISTTELFSEIEEAIKSDKSYDILVQIKCINDETCDEEILSISNRKEDY